MAALERQLAEWIATSEEANSPARRDTLKRKEIFTY